MPHITRLGLLHLEQENTNPAGVAGPSKDLNDYTATSTDLAGPFAQVEGAVSLPAMSQVTADCNTDNARCVGNLTNFKASWKAYTSGNIVSRHAARLIASVTTMTLARSNDFGPEADEDDLSLIHI